MRSKVSISLSLMTLVALLSMLLATAVFVGHAGTAYAAGGPTAVTGQGIRAGSVQLGSLSSSSSSTTHQNYVVPIRPIHPSNGQSKTGAPSSSPTSGSDTHPLLHNFNGTSAPDNERLNGFDVEPPDQGLCVGNGYVMEAVNLVVSVYKPNGTLLKAVSIPNFFNEPPAFNPNFGTNVQG